MKKLYFEVDLNKGVEQVFNTLFTDEYYQIWTKPFNPDTAYTGEIKKGNEIFFYDSNGNGMKALVTEYISNKVIELSYLADVNNGVETKFSNSEQNYERYTFSESANNRTRLEVELLMPSEFEEFFSSAWSDAIALIKKLYSN